jgi:hypothetical protein
MPELNLSYFNEGNGPVYAERLRVEGWDDNGTIEAMVKQNPYFQRTS